MVNVVREPQITPGRPRVSSGASTSLSRSQADTSGKSRIPRLVTAPSTKKRAPLGEMSDNVSIAASQGVSKYRASTSKTAVRLSQNTRKSSLPVPSSISRGRTSSTQHPKASLSAPTPPPAGGSEGQLLDITISDMPELSETDESDIDDPNAGLRQMMRKGLKASLTGKEPRSSDLQSITSSRQTAMIDPISHLPTPPPSQSNFLATPPRSSLSQRRPRPSITPPRHQSGEASSSRLLSPAIITEPSPNPRRKKSPRTTQDSRHDDQSTPQATIRKGKGKSRTSLESNSSNSQPTQESALVDPTAAPVTSRKPRASKPRKSVATPKTSTPKQRSSRRSSAGPSGDISRAGHSLTPAGKRLVQAGGSTLLKKAIRATPGEDPLLLGGWDEASMRRRSRAAADLDPLDGDGGESEEEADPPPRSRDKGKGRAIVFPSPPHDNPGGITSPGLPPIAKHPSTDMSASLSRFVADLPDPLADESMDFGGAFNDGGFASASDDEEALVGNDTFYHVRARQKLPEIPSPSASLADMPIQASGKGEVPGADAQPSPVSSEEVPKESDTPLGDANDILTELEPELEDANASTDVGLDNTFTGPPTPSAKSPPAESIPSPLPTMTIISSAVLTQLSAQTEVDISLDKNQYHDYVSPLVGGEETEDEGNESLSPPQETSEDMIHEELSDDDGSSPLDGDVTLEGISENWDVSSDLPVVEPITSMKEHPGQAAEPVLGDAEIGDLVSEPRDHDQLQDKFNCSTSLVEESQLSTASTTVPTGDTSSEEEEEPLEESFGSDSTGKADESAEAVEPTVEAVTLPPAASERIVLKIIPRGVVKLEPETAERAEDSQQSVAPVAEDVEKSPPAPIPTSLHASSTASAIPVAPPPPPPSPPISRSIRHSTPVSATVSAPVISTTPTASPPPRSREPRAALLSTEPVVSRVEKVTIPTVASKIPSKLSQQWSLESPSGSSETVPSANASCQNSPILQPRQAATEIDEGNDSIRISEVRPSLLDELASGDGDTSFTSVVEISSLDPRAAARAAAILKMNHAYIEHGQKPKKPTTPHHSRRRSLHQSQHLASIEASRHLTKEELLHEAELELVTSQRGRGRSMSVYSTATGVTAISAKTSATDLAVPGGWVNSPKRKREQAVVSTPLPPLEVRREEVKSGNAKAWTVKDWRRLEKAFIAEKRAWVHEREVKQMPGGFTSWATRSFRAPEAVKEWNSERVVTRFLAEEGVEEGNGEWARDVIALRVGALERRVTDKMSSFSAPDERAQQAPSPKKRRQETPMTPAAKEGPSAAPPSTLSKVFNFMFSPWSSLKEATVPSSTGVEMKQNPASAAPASGSSILDGSVRHKAKATHLRDEIRAARPSERSESDPQSTPFAVEPALVRKAVPRAPTQWSAQILPPIQHSTESPATRIKSWTADVSTNAESAIATPPSSFTATRVLSTTPSIYPPLPSITQRSAALKALFPAIHPLNDSTASNASAGSSTSTASLRSQPVSIPKRSNSIQDLVKSFEEAKTLDRVLEKREGGLRKCQSSSSLRRAE